MTDDSDDPRVTLISMLRHFRINGEPPEAGAFWQLDWLFNQNIAREFQEWAKWVLNPTPAPADFRTSLASAFLGGKAVDPASLKGEEAEIALRFYDALHDPDEEEMLTGLKSPYDIARLHALHCERARQYLNRIQPARGKPRTKESVEIDDLLTLLLVLWQRSGQKTSLPNKSYVEETDNPFFHYVLKGMKSAEDILLAYHLQFPAALAAPDSIIAELRRLRTGKQGLLDRLRKVRKSYGKIRA